MVLCCVSGVSSWRDCLDGALGVGASLLRLKDRRLGKGSSRLRQPALDRHDVVVVDCTCTDDHDSVLI